MKYFILYTTLSVCVLMSVLSMNDIVRAFKSGDATEISKFLDNSVEITLDGKNKTYNNSQSLKILTDFFGRIKVTDFKVLHQSESSGSAYCIGNLITSEGNYRITLFAKDKNGKTLLQEIRFEK